MLPGRPRNSAGALTSFGSDNAIANVLTVLRDAAAGEPPYGFVDAARRARARTAVARGVDIILRTQVKQGGRLTAWAHSMTNGRWSLRGRAPRVSELAREAHTSVGTVRKPEGYFAAATCTMILDSSLPNCPVIS